MNQNKLPADPSSMILGIVALVIIIGGCCCYGLVSIVSLALGIIGLVNANRSLKEYANNPEVYLVSSRSNVYTAKVLNIIAIVISSLWMVFLIVVLIIYGALFSGLMLNNLKNIDQWNEDDNFEYQYEYHYEENESIETDSLYHYQDSTEVEQLNEI
jgi:hypothetical protein